MSTDIAIVGAGLTGLVAAYRVRQAVGEDAAITVFDPAGPVLTAVMARTVNA